MKNGSTGGCVQGLNFVLGALDNQGSLKYGRAHAQGGWRVARYCRSDMLKVVMVPTSFDLVLGVCVDIAMQRRIFNADLNFTLCVPRTTQSGQDMPLVLVWGFAAPQA